MPPVYEGVFAGSSVGAPYPALGRSNSEAAWYEMSLVRRRLQETLNEMR